MRAFARVFTAPQSCEVGRPQQHSSHAHEHMHYYGIQSPENSTQVLSTAEEPPGDSSEPRSWQATPSGDVRRSAACDMKSGCQSKPKRTHRQRSLLLTRCQQGGTLCHRVRSATHTMHALPRGASLHRVPLSRQHDSPRSHGCERSRMQVATRIILRCRHSATDSLTSSHLTSRGARGLTAGLPYLSRRTCVVANRRCTHVMSGLSSTAVLGHDAIAAPPSTPPSPTPIRGAT